jgi:hypothetical protein
MLDNSKNLDTSSAESVTIPSMIAGLTGSKMDMKKYRVRVERFQIDADMGEVAALERLYTAGIDGSGDVVILKEKTFTDKEVMIVVVVYMEKRPTNDPASVLKSIRDLEE